MKKLMLLIVIFCISNIKMQGQSPTPLQFLDTQATQPNNTPERYFHIADSIMQVVYGSDSTEAGPMNEYQRFKHLFETRCAAVCDSVPITKAYMDALIDARTRGPNGCGNDDTYRGKWQNIGPRTDVQNRQNQGMVTDIWSAPGDPSHIRIGTVGGGIWETENTGVDWINMTDNVSTLGTIGIKCMEVNPHNIYMSEMYMGAHMFIRPPWGNDHLGMGIWHTTNADLGALTTWTLETNGIPNADIKCNKIKYCPYLVNGMEYVVATCTNDIGREVVLGKLGSGPWVNLTPNFVNGAWNCVHFTDIEFMPDNPGKILIASEWPALSWMVNQGIYEIKFDLTTGGPAAPNVTLIMDQWLNGNQVLFCGNPSLGRALSFSVEYMGGGKVYMAYNLDNGSGCTPDVFNTNVAEFNLSNPAIITNLVTGVISDFQFHGIGLEAAYQEDVMFLRLGTGQANYIYKNNGAWFWKAISHYGHETNPDRTLHGDVRSMLIVKDVEADQNHIPGEEDIVYWGTDGGLSRTTNHNYNAILTPNNSILDPLSRTSDNLNGNNLMIGRLWDADREVFDRAYSGAGWDNGTHYYNKAANIWAGNWHGDGVNGNFDKRISDGTNFTLVKREYSTVDIHINPTAGVTLNNFGVVNQPETPGLWRPSPMQYRKGFMNIGLTRAWQSNPVTNIANQYFNGPFTTPSFNLNATPAGSEINQRCMIERLPCRQFMVTPSNDNQAYFLIFGSKLKGLLSRGIRTGFPLAWDWVTGVNGKDITPQEVYDLTDGVPATDFCVDDQAENRIFLALGGIASAANPRRVLFSEDGGDTWHDMSNGLTKLPVNCIVYQNGSEDVLYAGTDDGAYYWDKTLFCWIKMNGSIIKGKTIPNTTVTKLTINYCTRTLIAATHGRGIWESELYYPNHFPAPTEIIETDTDWGSLTQSVVTNKLIEGSIFITNGATLTIQGVPNIMTGNTATSSNTTIYMPKWGRIDIDKGSKLIVNGAHITNGCNTNWMGIFAWGHGAVAQTQNPNTSLDPNHGWVALNKAIIEHAEEALNNSGGDNSPWTNTGGIIQSWSSHFINNRRSAAFMQYSNLSGVVLNPDMSLFRDNHFDYNGSARIGLYAHISMWGIWGIKIADNVFDNTRVIDVNNPTHKTAVLSIDAGYGFTNNFVNNMYKGLEGDLFSYGSVNKSLSILGNTFDANEIGIHLQNITYPIITDNTINIGHRQTFGSGGGFLDRFKNGECEYF